MSYVDTVHAVQANYSFIHNKQVYDTIATQLGAHAAWQFIESVDFVSGTTTYTTYVWKNKSTASGLTADFYVGFMVQYANNVGAGLGYSGTVPVRVYLFEQYNSTTHTATKIAIRESNTSQTLNADSTNASSWVLSAAPSTTDPNIPLYGFVGPYSTNTTAFRTACIVANDAIIINQLYGPSTVNQTYVGAYDSVLGATLDPLPLTLISCGSSMWPGPTNGSGSSGGGSSTRHPSMGGATGTCFHGCGPSWYFQTSTPNQWIAYAGLLYQSNQTLNGSVGVADTNASLWGIPVSRACLSVMGNPGSASTRGGLRGFYKYVLSVNLATHSFGDTFTVDGVTYMGVGVTQYAGLFNTTV